MNRSKGSWAPRTAALALLLLGVGCSSVKPFTYRPAATKAAAPTVAARIAVLPFEDATEDYVKKGSYFQPGTLYWNLARGGIPTVFEPVTAPLWAQAFARELDASGRFQAVRYCVDATEVQAEDYVVSGTLLRADAAGAYLDKSTYEFRAVATRQKDGRGVWERRVARSVVGKPYEQTCGAFGVSCIVDRLHEDLRVVLAGMFEEAGDDLARTLAGNPGQAGSGAPAPGAKPAPAAAVEGEQVDETIRKILEGK